MTGSPSLSSQKFASDSEANYLGSTTGASLSEASTCAGDESKSPDLRYLWLLGLEHAAARAYAKPAVTDCCLFPPGHAGHKSGDLRQWGGAFFMMTRPSR